jgi:hypothetical protein
VTIPDSALHSGLYRGIAKSKVHGRAEIEFAFKWKPNQFGLAKPQLGEFDVEGRLVDAHGPHAFSGNVVVVDAKTAISQWLEVTSPYLLHGIARSFLLLTREVTDRPLFSATNIEAEKLRSL